MSIMPEPAQSDDRINDTRTPAELLIDETMARWVRQYPAAAKDDGWSEDRRDGYAEGYLDGMQNSRRTTVGERTEDVVRAAIEALDAFYADTPGQAMILLSLWSRRAELTNASFAEVVTALHGEDEVCTALISLWARWDQLAAIEVNAIRAALAGQRDDLGFAEQFLARQRRQRLAAEDAE